MSGNSPRSRSSRDSSPESNHSGSSSADSDDTVVQVELRKHLILPPTLSDENNDELFDNEESDSTSVSGSTEKPGSNQVTTVERAHKDDPPKSHQVLFEQKPGKVSNSSEVKSKVDTSKKLEHDQVNQAEPIKKGRPPSVVVKKSGNLKWASRLERTKRIHKVVSDEIEKKESWAQQCELADQNDLSNPQNDINEEVKGEVKEIETSLAKIPTNHRSHSGFEVSMDIQSRINASSRIPRLIMDQLVVKAAVEKIAKRKKFRTTYAAISEILRVKKILAKGNPFVIIPQYAYDISKVPGIRMAHIQLLLKQWENYFAEYLYQVIQIEYSTQFSAIQSRINSMANGGEKFKILRDFQSFIGGDEVSVINFSHSNKVQAIQPGPSTKRTKLDEAPPTLTKEKTSSRKSSKKSLKGVVNPETVPKVIPVGPNSDIGGSNKAAVANKDLDLVF